jgi:hypothetical protein
MSRTWYVDPHPDGVSVHLDPLGDEGEDDPGDDFYLAEDMSTKDDAKRLADALNDRTALLEVCRSVVGWIHNPDENALERFERIAEWFYRETGYLRPGKSEALEATSPEGERDKAWNRWVETKNRQMVTALRAAIEKAEAI